MIIGKNNPYARINIWNREWLLCDFHIHTNMSDGKLSLREVVDLYAKHGIDVIAITDHVLDKDTIKIRIERGDNVKSITRDNFEKYLRILWREQCRAWREYGMILIPGVELTNDKDRYHILVLDIKEYIDPSLPVEEIIERARDQNALTIAAHPDRKKIDKEHHSWYLWINQDKFKDLFDAWEIANRDDLFNAIGVRKFNYVANSDFHEVEHIYSWKTLLRAERNIEDVKEAIRKNTDVALYLLRKVYPIVLSRSSGQLAIYVANKQ